MMVNRFVLLHLMIIVEYTILKDTAQNVKLIITLSLTADAY